ncbi:head-tail connector protein [Desulfosporosinus sp. SB140]|uniref:head-tail connector protein n=1 Tax=Desulfosporosinus paludis TaxID=3115649 RepID=UPI00388EE09A
MNLVLTVPPAVEPLSLQEVKDYLRVDNDTDTTGDNYLSALMTAAREYCEGFQNRAYITQTWQMSFDYWPSYVINIPRGNLQTINSVSYKNSAGAVTPLTEILQYVVSTRGVLGRISPPYAQPWPPFIPFPLDAVVIEFVCGYGDTAESVPEKVKQAMKLLVSHWYENRTPLTELRQAPAEIAFTVSALLWQDRIVVA